MTLTVPGELETERLSLAVWDEAHLEDFLLLAAEAEVTRYIGPGGPFERAWAVARFQDMLVHWEEHGFGWRSAVEKETRGWLGFIGINRVPPEAVEVSPGEVEIGWWLTPRVWGRGLATEGALAVRDEAFGSLGLQRVIGRHHPDNLASDRIMRRLGMSFERLAEGKHGEAVCIHAMSAETWRSLVPG